MTDWLSAGAMLLAGLIVGVVFLYAMKTRKKDDAGDTELRDLEAKRDALVLQLRELDEDPEEKARLENETANVLRRLDAKKTKGARVEARPVDAARSEERRVGKECRSRRVPDTSKKA